MPSSLRWPDAALAGFACSMRSFAGPGMLAARGRIRGRARPVVLLAATGEIAADKAPVAPPRTGVPALLGRIGSGAYTGREVAGLPGAAAGSVAAALGTFATWRARGLVVETTGLPDPVVAVAEDMLAYGLAAVATRPATAGDASPGDASPGGASPGDADPGAADPGAAQTAGERADRKSVV